MQIPWKPLSRTDATRALSDLNGALPTPFSPANTRVRMAAMPFYQTLRFYELSDGQDMTKNVYVLHGGGPGSDTTFLLDGTNQPIYTANEIAPIELTGSSVIPYLGFFFAAVQGPYGAMTLIERLEAQDTDPESIAMLEAVKHLAPPRLLESAGRDGRYKVEGAMLFKDAVFRTVIEVTTGGLVQITEHEVVFGGMDPAST
jgi:hypothetical protein